MKKLVLICATGMFALSACTGNNEQQDASAPPQTVTTTESTPAEDGIVIHAGDNMKFDLTEIKVKAGETVKLTLRHTGKAPKTAMGHNFVLLKQGVSVDDFIVKTLDAKENDYIPTDGKDVIAHTRMLGGGESDHIEFTAPAKGTYDFICSFPAHAVMMHGKFIVE